MSQIQIINRTYEELRSCIEQAEMLASKASLTPQETRLHSTLLAKVSLLKMGISADELRRAEMERLAKLAGHEYPEAIRRTGFSSEESRDWFEFHKYGEKRSDYQSTAQWGRPSGESYSDSGGQGFGTQGATLVPANFQAKLFASMATYDEIIDPENSNLWESDEGSAATTPAVDDVSGSPVSFNKSVRVGETTQTSVQPVKFKSVNWSSVPTYRTGIVLVAMELEQDSFEPWAKLLEATFAQRHALAFGGDAIFGSGVAAVGGTPTVPKGLTTAIQAGSQVTSASSTLALSDLETLYHKLAKAYRAGAKFYCSDNTAQLITKLVETANRNNYKDDVTQLLNHDIVTCNSMNDWAAGVQNAVVFANPQYLLQRRVKNSSYIRRFSQAAGYVESGVYGYEGYLRADFQPILFDSNLPPVASLNAHS